MGLSRRGWGGGWWQGRWGKCGQSFFEVLRAEELSPDPHFAELCEPGLIDTDAQPVIGAFEHEVTVECQTIAFIEPSHGFVDRPRSGTDIQGINIHAVFFTADKERWCWGVGGKLHRGGRGECGCGFCRGKCVCQAWSYAGGWGKCWGGLGQVRLCSLGGVCMPLFICPGKQERRNECDQADNDPDHPLGTVRDHFGLFWLFVRHGWSFYLAGFIFKALSTASENNFMLMGLEI